MDLREIDGVHVELASYMLATYVQCTRSTAIPGYGLLDECKHFMTPLAKTPA